MSVLDFMLSLAVSNNHPRRAEWLFAHGAHADGRHAYSGRSLREEALVHGNQAMSDLLVHHGAAVGPLDERVAFQVACRKVHRSEARRLSELHPEYLQDSEIM